MAFLFLSLKPCHCSCSCPAISVSPPWALAPSALCPSAFLLQIALHSTLCRCCDSLPLTLYCGVHHSSSLLFSLECFWCAVALSPLKYFYLNILFPQEAAVLQGELGRVPTIILPFILLQFYRQDRVIEGSSLSAVTYVQYLPAQSRHVLVEIISVTL